MKAVKSSKIKTMGRSTTKSKYKNKKVGEFDSQKEAARYNQLKQMERQGLIANLEHHVKYELIPQQVEYIRRFSNRNPLKELTPKKVVLEQNVEYEADFVYVDLKTMNVVVEDSKGVRTAEYKIKRKLMLERHGIKIKET